MSNRIALMLLSLSAVLMLLMMLSLTAVSPVSMSVLGVPVIVPVIGMMAMFPVCNGVFVRKMLMNPMNMIMLRSVKIPDASALIMRPVVLIMSRMFHFLNSLFLFFGIRQGYF